MQRGNSPITIKQKGHMFTVNSSQVIGPGTTITLSSSYGVIKSINPAAMSMQPQPIPTPASKAGIPGISTTLTTDSGDSEANSMQSQPSPTLASGADTPGTSPILTTNSGAARAGSPRTSPTLTASSGGVDIEMSEISTVMDNISVQLGKSIAVVNGKTYSVGLGAPQVVTVINTQTVTIGIAGVEFGHTTLAPLVFEPTKHVIIGGEPISVGKSLAYIGSSTFTYGSGLAIQTDVFNGQTIRIYPSVVVFARTTLEGNSRSGNQIGIVGGLSVTEVGSSIAIISSITFNIGPGVTPTKTVISGEISDVTFTQIGSSLAVIDGTTFAFGLGAIPTSHTFNQQTIKIGSNGVEFAKTTFIGVSGSSSTQAMSTSTSEGLKFQTTGEDSTHASTYAAATSTDQGSDAGRINAPFEIYACITLGLIMIMTRLKDEIKF
ncbi:hypothetical protein BPOR_0035g00310 [Botrytis porri]|uniref:Uncharacterized protein n=1 Tax=Botrytis porri TaxID=87229 RepID=A0A4Z1L346_9HELO|nr:hypothetical protein BPOR_0035g00310 [Botrytis porri]